MLATIYFRSHKSFLFLYKFLCAFLWICEPQDSMNHLNSADMLFLTEWFNYISCKRNVLSPKSQGYAYLALTMHSDSTIQTLLFFFYVDILNSFIEFASLLTHEFEMGWNWTFSPRQMFTLYYGKRTLTSRAASIYFFRKLVDSWGQYRLQSVLMANQQKAPISNKMGYLLNIVTSDG